MAGMLCGALRGVEEVVLTAFELVQEQLVFGHVSDLFSDLPRGAT